MNLSNADILDLPLLSLNPGRKLHMLKSGLDLLQDVLASRSNVVNDEILVPLVSLPPRPERGYSLGLISPAHFLMWFSKLVFS